MAFYGLGTVFPESWWGTHFLAFLSPPLKFGLPIAALGLLLYFHFKPLQLQEQSTHKKTRVLLPVFAAVMMGVLFYYHPIWEDVYGDALMFEQALQTDQLSDAQNTSNIVSLNVLHPKNGERTVLSAVQLMADGPNDYANTFSLIDALCGALYVFLWGWFVGIYFTQRLLRFVFYVIGLSAPFLLLFYGHIEIYAPSIPVVSAYLMCLLLYFKTQRKSYLWALIPLLFLSMKFHSAAVLLIPSLLLSFTHYMVRNNQRWIAWLGWKKIRWWLLLPLFAIGLCAYFFVLKDHNDPRFLNPDISVYERLFLPLFSPEAPLDRYNLLSWNHLFDYGNMMLLWSSAGLFVLLTAVLFYRKSIDWNRPEIGIVGITFILYAAFFFMVNPLLSMPMDWDLFSLPAPLLLFFTAALAASLAATSFAKNIVGGALALSLLSVSVFVVNTQREPLSYRLEQVGIHTFKTYWIRSAGNINFGIDMMPHDESFKLMRRINALQQLSPFAVTGNDVEYAHLNWQVAKQYRTEAKDYQQALHYHQEAYQYSPGLNANLVGMVETLFLLRNFTEAHRYAEQLAAVGYPNERSALRIAIHCALEAELYDKAQQHCDAYLRLWPDDDAITYVWENLKSGTHLHELKKVFEGQ